MEHVKHNGTTLLLPLPKYLFCQIICCEFILPMVAMDSASRTSTRFCTKMAAVSCITSLNFVRGWHQLTFSTNAPTWLLARWWLWHLNNSFICLQSTSPPARLYASDIGQNQVSWQTLIYKHNNLFNASLITFELHSWASCEAAAVTIGLSSVGA